jgi:spectinomycin phosphotransferase
MGCGSMKSRPAGVTDADVAAALESGWGLRADSLAYAPVGAGSYHWTAGRYFVTVDDLDDKPWLGSNRSDVLDGLRAAMGVALSLAELPFVLAPIDGSVERLGERYAVTVFPYLHGKAGEWGQRLSSAERAEVVDMLAALHQVTLDRAPARPVELAGRASLEDLLDDPSSCGGPFAEEVKALLTEAGPRIRELLATFDRLSPGVSRLPVVITHGEPHPGNVLRTATGPMLIDWDTAGLAAPERDLWLLDGDNSGDFTRYEEATGYRPDPAALGLYRLRWRLDDISSYLTRLAITPHSAEDTAFALRALQSLTRPDLQDPS